MAGGSIVDHTGSRFGKLTVLLRERYGGKGGYTQYRCLCDCGKETKVRHSNLHSGATTSCGCHRLLVLTTIRITHGKSHSPTWNSWSAMRDRCLVETNKDFPNYGGRGITICAAWATSFESFLRDMGERPKGTSIERKDNSVGYNPGNCAWATALVQGNNKRNNRFIEFGGERLTLAQWGRRLGLSPEGIASRLRKWPLEQALTQVRR